jgi:D-glycero-D-manno-heptose 1,7-bisphosphate phosphatase
MGAGNMNRAVFVDKDGTLVHDVPYNVEPSLVQLQEEAADGLKMLKDNGYLIIVITNQSGVARGYFEERDLLRVESQLKLLLKQDGIELDGFYYCPHHPEGIVREYALVCNCRKPKSGMILQAADDLDIDVAGSWMIGDILDDVEAGNMAGCKTILIDNNHETEWKLSAERQPTYRVRSIKEAARVILQPEPS